MTDEPFPDPAVLADLYDLVLCDVYGTLYNGDGPFAEVIAALCAVRARGGTVVLVSNAATTGPTLAADLVARGIDAFDAAVTSADVTRTLLIERRIGRVCHLGFARERCLFDGLDLELVGVEAAEIAVCTGYPEAEPDANLRLIYERDLDLVCTNPDITVIPGPPRLRFAGLVAAAYAALGGNVIATGKPHASIYDLALARAHCVTHGRFAHIVAMGDSLDLDVGGALARGYDAVQVSARDASGHVSFRLFRGG